MTVKILADKTDYLEAINEESQRWLEELLVHIGLDVEILRNSESSWLVEYFMKNRVDIFNFPDLGAIQVYLDGEVIGEWGEPQFKLKKVDGEEYYEISIENWSIAEES